MTNWGLALLVAGLLIVLVPAEYNGLWLLGVVFALGGLGLCALDRKGGPRDR